MNICIISTSRVAAANLGDRLIADRCTAMVKDIAADASVTTIFRGEEWTKVREIVTSSDLIVIACLAIRSEMLDKAYPFLRELTDCGVPIVVLSAGLSLSAFSARDPLSKLLSTEEVDVLRALADKSLFFSSRGYLTQSLLDDVGVKSVFAGDVAFYEPRFAERTFGPVERISRIAVSDPHYAPEYKASFLYLVDRLKGLFPAAKIDLLIHGTNAFAIEFAQEAGIEHIEMSRSRGLSHYDDYDLHVGYRIHGHVSSLARRIPSYLLEQDDRGTDYGSTFTRRVSVASHRNISRRAPDGYASKQMVLTSPVETLVAVLRQDMNNQFSRFAGLEVELEACVSRNYTGLKAAIDGLHSPTRTVSG